MNDPVAISLADLLGGAGKPSKDYRATISKEVQIERLKEHYENYKDTKMNGCPFKPGDLVTPRPDCNIVGAGQPHVVIDVMPRGSVYPIFSSTENAGSSGFGKMMDFRIICMPDNESVAPFWGESWQYERWERSED